MDCRLKLLKAKYESKVKNAAFYVYAYKFAQEKICIIYHEFLQIRLG